MTVVIGVILGIYFGYRFYYQNLRGIGPAILPPAQNADKLLEERLARDANPEPYQGNSTGLPLTIPNGFSISIFAKDLGNPRVLVWDPNGTLLVSIPDQGKVIALPDSIDDYNADGVIIVVDGLNKPHGIAFHPKTKKLYIAETDQVAMYDYDQGTLQASNKKKIVDLPAGGNHFSRTIGFGPDGRLYIAVGSSCNVCIEKDNRRAKILVANTDGSNLKEFATGLRNSVFFTWHPVTKEMWATEMGRDLIGDDIPPDEINIIKEGGNYGWPICYGKNIHDTNFDKNTYKRNPCLEPFEHESFIDIPAHSAPLGLTFVPNSWPKEYQGDVLVAYHGSWNRSTPTGYKVVRMKFNEKGNYIGVEDFITGWFPPDGGSAGALGRPVDLLFDQKGILYISDDKAGVIYRVAPPSSI